jgi:glyoxylase-like metal-dependent hydrolase (beta-lactamase superfamily II)
MKKASIALLVAALLCGCRKSPELRVVVDAATAMGGKDKIQSVNTLTIEGQGEDENLGQNVTPEAPLTSWKVSDFRETLDARNGRMRIEQVRTAQFPFAGETVTKQNMSIDGDVAWNVDASGPSARLTETAAHERRLELLRNPLSAVRVALDPKSQLSHFRETGNKRALDIVTPAGDMFTLALDSQTSLPVSVSTAMAHPNLGDTVVEATFGDYEDAGGLRLPNRITTKIDKSPLSDIQVSKYTINGSAPDLTAPSNLKAQLPAPAEPLIDVTTEKVAPGVWLLGGAGNHHSVAFEFADHLTLFELPESEARSRAVIEKTHSLAFGKPLTEVIISHHHFDHSAGLRAAVAEGLTIITQRGNEAFFKDLAARKHTIEPDQLAKNPTARPIRIKTVDDEMVLKDASMELDLYHVKDNSHSDTLLMGWVPSEHILVQADLYDSGWFKFPWADNLRKNVEMRKLRVEKDVPVHGDVEAWADVMKTMQSKQ